MSNASVYRKIATTLRATAIKQAHGTFGKRRGDKIICACALGAAALELMPDAIVWSPSVTYPGLELADSAEGFRAWLTEQGFSGPFPYGETIRRNDDWHHSFAMIADWFDELAEMETSHEA